MDRSSKKHCPGVEYGRTRSSITSRDPNRENKSTHGCNRLGCSSRHNFTNESDNNSEKLKTSKTTLHMIIKPTIASSSKTMSPLSLRKPKEKRSPPSLSKKNVGETSRRKDFMVRSHSSSGREAVESLDSLSTSTGSHDIDNDPNNLDSGIFSRLSTGSAGASCSRNMHSETRNLNIRQIRPGGMGDSSGSSIRRPIASRNTNQPTNSPRGLHTDPQRYGLRNLSCRSINDALESSSSSASPSYSRSDTLRRKHPNTESSRSKAVGGSSIREASNSMGVGTTPPSASRRASTQPASQRLRTRPSDRYRAPPTREPDASHRRESRTRFVEFADDMFSLPEPFLIPQEPHLQFPVGESAITRSPLSFTETAATQTGYNGGARRGTHSSHSRQGIHIVDGPSQTEFDPCIDRSSHHHLNMDGIAEVLLALDRIEHDEELSYEQLMMLETNLLLGGFSFHDQHRDMRLDIDNMSYEELLALGERMGTVNTSLSEEEMSKFISKSFYKSILASSHCIGGGVDVKCSICQEEYIEGEEVGKLICHHLYHVGCIREWLQMKNWCPICKSSALPSLNGTTTAHVSTSFAGMR